jgi:hypothetical protein
VATARRSDSRSWFFVGRGLSQLVESHKVGIVPVDGDDLPEREVELLLRGGTGGIDLI